MDLLHAERRAFILDAWHISCHSSVANIPLSHPLSCRSSTSCIGMHRFEDRCATLASMRSERTWRARGAPTDARFSDHCNASIVDHNLACNTLHLVNLHKVQPGQRDPRYWCNEFAGGLRHVDMLRVFFELHRGVSGSSCDRARKIRLSWISGFLHRMQRFYS